MIKNLDLRKNIKRIVCMGMVLITITGPVPCNAKTMVSERTGHVYETNGNPPTTHTIQEDELLWGIAKLYYGDGDLATKLAAYNGINARNLHVGQVIKIPTLETLLAVTDYSTIPEINGKKPTTIWNNIDLEVKNYKSIEESSNRNNTGYTGGEYFVTTKSSKKLQINHYILMTNDTVTYTLTKSDSFKNLSIEYYGHNYAHLLADYNGLNKVIAGKVIVIPTLEELFAYGDRLYAASKNLYNLYDISIYKYGTDDYAEVLADLNGIDINYCYSIKVLNLYNKTYLNKYLSVYPNLKEGETLKENYYIVKDGDTLGKIVYKHYGSKEYVDYIKEINGIKTIKKGQILYLPTIEKEKVKTK